ncbi:MAG: DUF1292 domain-containing protein [bacterium]
MSEESNIVILEDEDGQEHEYEVEEIYEIDGKEYAVLLSTEEDSDNAFVFRVEQDEQGDDILVDITDDTEWDKVVSAIEEIESEEE